MDRLDRPETREPAGLTLAVLALLRGVPADDWLEGDHRDLAITLHRLRVLQGLAHERADEIQQQLVDSMETDDEIAPGLGVIHREETTSSRWKDKSAAEDLRQNLSTAVADTIARDVASGELDQMKRNVALATMRLALEAIPAFSSLNKAGRERLGILISDYREYSTGYKISIEAVEDDV